MNLKVKKKMKIMAGWGINSDGCGYYIFKKKIYGLYIFFCKFGLIKLSNYETRSFIHSFIH